ncbi:hypothetical protein [Natrinema amylolyticum]|uniref:hypothetical protein n=1 Tax=Natrinema amylolyticum TaxID=2878679 RepID=UPI001CFB90B1|nr:hypothetical protein [Natrinema amylolyticum]
MTDGNPDAPEPVAADASTDADAAESDGHSSFPPCPHCDDRVVTVTSRGPMTHVAGPCGCRLTPRDVRRL